jgi:hypothetical protein
VPIERIISGGQTGADLGGLLAAERLGMKTGGVAAAGFRTEKGKQPILGKRFGLSEHSSWQYPPRTEENVRLSCVTLIFSANATSRGTQMTIDFTVKHKKEYLLVDVNAPNVELIIDFIHSHAPTIINIAGNRESVSPGVTRKTRDILYNALSKVIK